jgi:hypothetical protein
MITLLVWTNKRDHHKNHWINDYHVKSMVIETTLLITKFKRDHRRNHRLTGNVGNQLNYSKHRNNYVSNNWVIYVFKPSGQVCVFWGGGGILTKIGMCSVLLKFPKLVSKNISAVCTEQLYADRISLSLSLSLSRNRLACQPDM